MAVYSKLLLSSGGGIISTQQQAEQVKNTASLLIGLGGTGIDCLRTLKTQVYSRLKPDDPEAVIAAYSHIRFLGVDSAEKSRGSTAEEIDATKGDSLLALDDTEFFPVSHQNIKKAFHNTMALQQRSELSWLRWEDIPVPDLGKAGLGGIRQIGRFVIMDRSKLFMNRIEQEIRAAKSGLSDPPVNIHIFCGLCGGTGAGAFLDVCYMIRSVADKLGGATVFGYFFLPDVNLANIPSSATQVREYIPRNGYASMQELDYCMQLQYNGGSFVQEYQDHKKIEWRAPPVDMCHLVCATNSSGDVIPNAYNYAMNVTSEYVMDFLTYSDAKFGLEEHLANFRKMVSTADGGKTIGSQLAYTVIGASCASIPLKEINTYLVSELFDRFSTVRANTPTRKDVEELAIAALAKDASSVQDIYNALYREIQDGASNEYTSYADDWKFVRDYGNADMVSHYTNQTAAKRNRVETNGKSMVTETNRHSLLGRVRAQLGEVLRDIDRGPIFAYRMLSAAESHNFLNIIDGLIEENNSRWSQETAQADLRSGDYNAAKSDFDNRRGRKFMDNDQKRFGDYEYYLLLLEQHKLQLSIYEKLNSVLKEFRKQVADSTASYYIRLSRVTETLLNTFKENRDALASEKIMQSSGSFAIPMMTISELKKSLDEEIEKINISGMLDTFMQLLLDNEDEWLLEDENKITKLVTRFFVETAFEGFANRTITAFLKDKYGIDNDERLSNKIYEEWMKLLTAKASPLFYFNDAVWSEAKTTKMASLSYPATSAAIKAAAQKMEAVDDTWKPKESALTDRIYVMCNACVLPLSGYNNCDLYEEAYFSTTEVGRHYYEGKPVAGMVFDDWRELPSLTPQSLLDLARAPAPMRAIVSAAQEIYEEADRWGLFDAHNRIYAPDETAVEKLKALTEDCRAAAKRITKAMELPDAQKLLAELVAAEKLPMKVTPFAMQDDGHAADEKIKKSVQKDHFVASPVYQRMVRETLAQIRSLQSGAREAEEALRGQIARISEGGREITDFCDALFAGVIRYEGQLVSYDRDPEGLMLEIPLSRRGDEFPLNRIPVYQGFLSYQAMDPEVKAEIKEAANTRYNRGDPRIQANGRRLKEMFTDDRIRAWNQTAANYEQHLEILEFLRKLRQNFHTFCLDNGIKI